MKVQSVKSVSIYTNPYNESIHRIQCLFSLYHAKRCQRLLLRYVVYPFHVSLYYDIYVKDLSYHNILYIDRRERDIMVCTTTFFIFGNGSGQKQFLSQDTNLSFSEKSCSRPLYIIIQNICSGGNVDTVLFCRITFLSIATRLHS